MKHLFPVGEEIGRGFEKVVYDMDGNDKKVVGEFHWEENKHTEFVRARFYLTKILHYFCSEIPDMHLSSANPQTVIMEKVELDPVHTKASKNDGFDAEHRHRARKFAVPFLSMMHNEFGVAPDPNDKNFSISSEGNLKYVDTVIPFDERAPYDRNFDIGKIRAKIATVKSERDKERLTGWADRLEKLTRMAEDKRDSIGERFGLGKYH